MGASSENVMSPEALYIARNHIVDYVLLGTEGAEHFVSLVEERAQEQELHGSSFDVVNKLRLIDLHIALGIDFLIDPQLREVTSNLGNYQGEFAVRELGDAARTYLNQVAGPGGSWYQTAMQRAVALPAQQLTNICWARNDQMQIVAMLRDIFPQKMNHFSDIGALVDVAAQWAEELGSAQGIPQLLLVVMVLLGSGVRHDPRYPWASPCLSSAVSPAVTAQEVLQAMEAGARAAFDLHRAVLESYSDSMTGGML